MKHRRYLITVLTLALLLAIFPMTAFAADQDFSAYWNESDGCYHFGSEDASDFITYLSWKQYADGQTFVLDGNIALASTPVIQSTVTLKLNGYQLSRDSSGGATSLLGVDGPGNLTIIGGNGSLEWLPGDYWCIQVANAGTLTIQDTNIAVDGDTSRYGAIYTTGAQNKVTITGGSIDGGNRAFYDNSTDSKITLNGVTITGDIFAGKKDATPASFMEISGGTSINGGLSVRGNVEISGTETFISGDVTVESTGSLTVNNGQFNGTFTNNSGNIVLNGGVYAQDPSDFVDADTAVAKFTAAGGKDAYVIGVDAIKEKAGDAKQGDTITILSGDIELANMADGITIKNEGSGTVSVNGAALLPGSDEIITHTHAPVAVKAAEATCTQPGNREYWYCAGCDKYFSDAQCTTEIGASDTTIAAKGHHAIRVEAKKPTKTESGNLEYWYCDACKSYFKDAELTQPTTLEAMTLPATGTADTSDMPKTGDTNSRILWSLLLIGSLCAAGMALYREKIAK